MHKVVTGAYVAAVFAVLYGASIWRDEHAPLHHTHDYRSAYMRGDMWPIERLKYIHARFHHMKATDDPDAKGCIGPYSIVSQAVTRQDLKANGLPVSL
jgi:hypothetical protein